jgi:hypothetical protein
MTLSRMVSATTAGLNVTARSTVCSPSSFGGPNRLKVATPFSIFVETNRLRLVSAMECS